jgi:cytoskeletal protein CcmA (bactofilin family)
MAKVEGDVDVESGSATGVVTIGGKLSAGTFHSRGTLEVVGTAEIRDQLTLEGTVHFEAGLRAGALGLQGTLRCPADVRVDRVAHVTGTIEAPSAHVGLLDLTGGAEIPGDLESLLHVRAKFRGDSRIGAIRARSVVLAGPPSALIPTLFRKVFGGSAVVSIGRIEADTVELAAVDVEFVHAREITLGAGAHVRELEGTVVRRHPSSRVGPESRSPHPHGLSR